MGRTILIIIGVVFIVFLVVWAVRQTGVRLFGGPVANLPTDLATVMPSTWEPLMALQPANIDDDTQTESLLFYKYDNGQIGGIIYDAQTTPLGNQGVPVPSQSPTYLVPYRLFPDYVGAKTNGYLSDATVEYQQVFINPDSNGNIEETTPRDRLQVRGLLNNRITRYSILWWTDPQSGYGGATTSTVGWLSLSDTDPDDWAAWSNNVYIRQLWNWEPLADRSNLCRRTALVLNDTSTSTAPNPPAFVRIPTTGDLVFCAGGLPQSPTFPEAQVLAYLKDGDKSRLAGSFQNAPQYSDAKVYGLSAPADLTTMRDGKIVVTGEVDFTSAGQTYRMWWATEMVPPANVNEAVQWKIVGLAPR